ncbi:signal transduction histidine kinase [Antricoccus suffuscus]|uniref:histidine kinase n=1 Tax=Antricoccus suffuscus TaxID=1629062 RepID=A0A2T0ZZH8_9ACTN|nr:histidine kinase [Antricoccus suffuscus]PRZ41498.1 signal transduction histidine kinase [Antricoccus suffuscus]
MGSRIFRWFDRHTWAGDAVLATILIVPIVGAYLFAAGSGTSWAAPLMSFLMLAPLYFRRRFPAYVVIATVIVCLISVAFWHEQTAFDPLASIIAVPIVVHAAVKYGPRPLWWFSLGAGLVGSILAPLYAWRNADPLNGIACFAVVLVAFLVGLHQRTKRETHLAEVASLAERNRLMEVEREQSTTIAVARERAQLAAETHDIIAHTLAVIVSQADGAVMAVEKRPEVAATVLAQIADTSRDALGEIRGRVAALRASASDPSADLHPTRSLADLDSMIAKVRATGLVIDVRRTGQLELAPLGLQLATYRIVQEALTNVIKHAGPSAAVTICLEVAGDVLSVRVDDDGRGSAAASNAPGNDGLGNGITGMRERAQQYGATLRAGPRVGGGFSVSAVFPLTRTGVDR